jgi:DNA-binding NarL/FixJ family response regulator
MTSKTLVPEIRSSSQSPARTQLPSPAKRKIFLLDDHAIFRHGLALLIDNEEDLTVCGGVASGPEALDFLRNNEVDAIIVDVSLAGANGIEFVKHIRAEHPTLPILVLSMHDENIYALRALRAGANGYLMKRESPEACLEALRSILSGQVTVSPTFGSQLIYRVANMDEDSTNPVRGLTDRELEILELVGNRLSTREISKQLHLSVKTVESHRLHLKKKLGLGSAADLVRFSQQWVEDGERALHAGQTQAEQRN